MDLMTAMRNRHSVRSYTDKKIEGEVLSELQKIIAECNQESGLHIQLCLEEPKAFSSMMAHYGKFRNVRNYIAIVGKKEHNVEEKVGYYGEKVVLKAAQLGLNTCWVALTYKKNKDAVVLEVGEKILIVIAIGYGENQGVPHRGKKLTELYQAEGDVPQWFLKGVEAAELAPTAVNQQKFKFILRDNKVEAVSLRGIRTKLDLGIAKYHFEIGAQGGDWKWQE